MNELFLTEPDWYQTWLHETLRYAEQMQANTLRMAEHWMILGIDALQKLPGWDQLRELSKTP